MIEAERMQLMTRAICMSTISLLIMTIVVLFILTFIYSNVLIPIKMLYIPLIYLVIMLFVTKRAAKSRADRTAVLVIKNAVQGL